MCNSTPVCWVILSCLVWWSFILSTFSIRPNTSICPFLALGGLLLACDFEVRCDKLKVVKGGDSYDWQLHRGGTRSVNTGPSVDHTKQNTQGKHLKILYVRQRCCTISEYTAYGRSKT